MFARDAIQRGLSLRAANATRKRGRSMLGRVRCGCDSWGLWLLYVPALRAANAARKRARSLPHVSSVSLLSPWKVSGFLSRQNTTKKSSSLSVSGRHASAWNLGRVMHT